jgi:hypothetical protein
MSSIMKKRILGLSMFSALLLAMTFLATSGCYIEDEYYYEDGVYLADLQVDWSIQGADSSGLCGVYGINRWIVEAHGPEARTTELNCSKYYWSTENDFAAMTEGTYVITVRAIDHLGHAFAAQSSSITLHDVGQTHTLHFDFLPTDFGF